MVIDTTQALRLLWTATCSAFTLESYVNKASGRTDQREIALFRGLPCRISYSAIATTRSQNAAEGVSQMVKLFIANSVHVPPGARISVTQHGQTRDYVRSGLPAVYSSHQEIMLEPFERYA